MKSDTYLLLDTFSIGVTQLKLVVANREGEGEGWGPTSVQTIQEDLHRTSGLYLQRPSTKWMQEGDLLRRFSRANRDDSTPHNAHVGVLDRGFVASWREGKSGQWGGSVRTSVEEQHTWRKARDREVSGQGCCSVIAGVLEASPGGTLDVPPVVSDIEFFSWKHKETALRRDTVATSSSNGLLSLCASCRSDRHVNLFVTKDPDTEGGASCRDRRVIARPDTKAKALALLPIASELQLM